MGQTGAEFYIRFYATLLQSQQKVDNKICVRSCACNFSESMKN
jgi:hypothetical protein